MQTLFFMISLSCKEWAFKILQGTSQAEQTTSSVVSKVARPWLHTETYTRKDKHEGRYLFEERSSEH